MRQKRSRQRDPKCRLKSIYFNHPSQDNSTNYYIILGPRASHMSTNKQISSAASEVPSDAVILFILFFIFISSSSTGELSLSALSQSVAIKVRGTGRIFPEHVERSFLDPEYSFVAVRRILRTIFAKQKFAQLRTNYIRRILPAMFASKCSPN